MTKRVMTVRGAIPPDELGVTLPHEHVIFDLRHSLRGIVEAVFDEVPLAVDELKAFGEAGGKTIVDLTNGCMGRNARALRQISIESGLNIVASTGYYTIPYYPAEVFQLATSSLAKVLIKELTEGIEGTDIRAGIIGEIGTGRDYLRPEEERVFRAAARAHRETGAPISTHTTRDELIDEQMRIFEEEEVQLERVIIGHLGDYRDIDKLKSIADRGVFVQLDHVGLENWQLDRQRARTIAELISAGHSSQILVSMDMCGISRFHWYGGAGFDYLLRSFVPTMRKEGIRDEDIETILIKNPARALAFDF